MTVNDRVMADSLAVLREEFDDWAILFNPDSGDAFGLNPVSVFIWKMLDGQHTIQDIVDDLRDKCKGVPEDAEKPVINFVQDLVDKGLAGYELQKG